MSPFRLGIVIAIVTLLFDQGTKRYLLDVFGLAERSPVTVTSWFDLVLVWNRGISYGLFQQDHWLGPVIFVAIAIGAAVFCTFWLKRAENRILAIGLGLLIGGALGNAIDRALYGAVVDFVALHYRGFSWYVFNVADVAIVAAVAVLLYDSLKSRPNLAEKSE